MDVTPSAGQGQHVEQFRNLLFHLQLEGNSLNDLLQFVKSEKSISHLTALKLSHPDILRQLMAREHVLMARLQNENGTKAINHLEQALQLDPCCPEACLEYGSLADSPEGAMKWYHRAMNNTIALLGEETFWQLIEAFKTNPWRQFEILTYIKAKSCLAEKLFQAQHYDVAALHFEEILSWNPADDLKIHHYQLICYLCLRKLKEAAYLMNEFRGDWSATWYYCKAFLQYKLMGENTVSRRLLLRAFQRNVWVPVYLLGLTAVPQEPPSTEAVQDEGEVLKIGSRAEAAACLHILAPVFYEDENLVEWAWQVLKSAV